jgi:hypothetical protein
MDLDSVLNFAIPTGILLFGVFYFYKLLKEPIDSFVGFIKGAVGKGKDVGDKYIPDGANDGYGFYYPRDAYNP